MKKNKLILICDDNELIIQIMSFALEAAGFNIDTAKNTDEIFRKLESDIKPSLIFLDLNIPEAGGESVIQQLRNKDETKNIPVILFSGQENVNEIAEKLKVEGFMRKPFTSDDLKKIANKFLLNS